MARGERAVDEVVDPLGRAGARDALVAKHAIALLLLRVRRVRANDVAVEFFECLGSTVSPIDVRMLTESS